MCSNVSLICSLLSVLYSILAFLVLRYLFCLFSCYSYQSISGYSWEVYIVHSRKFAGWAYMHEDRTWVGIFNLHRGPPVNVPIWRTAHCVHVIPANDTKGSVFGPPQIPPLPPAEGRRTVFMSYLQMTRREACLDHQIPPPLAPPTATETQDLKHQRPVRWQLVSSDGNFLSCSKLGMDAVWQLTYRRLLLFYLELQLSSTDKNTLFIDKECIPVSWMAI